MKLLASETIINNLIWKKLEICHAMRIEGHKVTEGFQIVTVHMIDAGMLPMSLQSFAGDCLIKKAIEIAPMVDWPGRVGGLRQNYRGTVEIHWAHD
jgi:hypothetical protein